jgi:hypothetical protein
LRIVTLRFGKGDSLERWSNPKLSRRAVALGTGCNPGQGIGGRRETAA